MAHPYDTLGRLKDALEFRDLDPGNLSVSSLCSELMKRGNSDRDVDRALSGIVDLLEPPHCYMTHCKHYGGVSSFCNCGLKPVPGEKRIIPGKCGILRDFNKRKKEKSKKIFDGLSEDEQKVLEWACNHDGVDIVRGMRTSLKQAIKSLSNKKLLYTYKTNEYHVNTNGQEVIRLGAPQEHEKQKDLALQV